MANPSARLLFSHPAHFIALGGGLGLAPKAPGTFGTLLGFPLWWFSLSLPPVWIYALIAAAFVIGIWACNRTGAALGVADHGGMVWDEAVAMWGVLLLTPSGWGWSLAAFVAFRIFDIWKPFPIGYFDRKVKGGFGVMLDDALAAVYAVAVLQITAYLMKGL
jgi:phosphatidylglycerophosphatase A